MSEELAAYRTQGANKAKPRHLESALQSACVRWFRLQYPSLLIYANMNHGKRSQLAGHLEQAAGLVAGIPDLFLAAPRGGYGGLYIEMKVGSNKPTAVQESAMKQLRQAGYATIVCYDLDSFMQHVNEYLSL